MDNGTLLMIFFAALLAIGILLIVSLFYIIHKHNTATKGHHLCEFVKLGGGCYRELLPIDSHGEIRPKLNFNPLGSKSKGNKPRSYFTDRVHTFTDRWPYGWPSFLQATVGKSYFMENLSDAILPPIIDQDGKVLGFQQILTAEYMGNLDREKVTEQVVGYGDREAEMNRAMANLPKPWLQWATLIASVIGFIILGVLSFLIYSRLGDAVIQTASR